MYSVPARLMSQGLASAVKVSRHGAIGEGGGEGGVDGGESGGTEGAGELGGGDGLGGGGEGEGGAGPVGAGGCRITREAGGRTGDGD